MNTPGKRPEKKPPEEKSKVYRFRLHPEVPDEATVMDLIRQWESNPDNGGLRKLVTEAVLLYAGMDLPSPSARYPVKEMAEIREMLQFIASHLESGEQSSPRRAQQSGKGGKLELSSNFLGSLGRFLNEGMYADDVEGDDATT